VSKRKNTFTRFLEDIIDDSKDFIDDMIDRAKDAETNAQDAIRDVVDDDEGVDDAVKELGTLKASLVDLTAKVDQLTQLAEAKK
jgi:polyhydroxyalkanoate synthesis regulator phasin